MKTVNVTARDLLDAMEYSSVMAESYEVQGYAVEVVHDSDADSPYHAWEGNSPALWLSLGNGLTEYGDSGLGRVLWDHFTPAQISRHWRAIAAALDLCPVTHDQDARENLAAYGGHLSNWRQELLAQALDDMRADSWGYGVDYLEALRALYLLAGIPAETFQRNGYCQGDSVYGLIVMTPAWAEAMGAPHAKAGKIDKAACAKDMAAQADIYGAWAFGDVYGFTVTAPNGDDCDSCFGFYGCDGDASGLFESICDAINSHARQAATARRVKLKALIAARAPLEIRAAALRT